MPRPEVRLGGWYDSFVKELARGLRQCERDARQLALAEAVNVIGDTIHELPGHACAQTVAVTKRVAIDVVQGLQQRARRRRHA
jgi:hypothetical protein